MMIKNIPCWVWFVHFAQGGGATAPWQKLFPQSVLFNQSNNDSDIFNKISFQVQEIEEEIDEGDQEIANQVKLPVTNSATLSNPKPILNPKRRFVPSMSKVDVLMGMTVRGYIGRQSFRINGKFRAVENGVTLMTSVIGAPRSHFVIRLSMKRKSLLGKMKERNLKCYLACFVLNLKIISILYEDGICILL